MPTAGKYSTLVKHDQQSPCSVRRSTQTVSNPSDVAPGNLLLSYDFLPNLDVLSGRGEFYKRNNRFYREAVTEYFPFYQACRDNAEKRSIAMEIVRIVHESGGRFLNKYGEEIPNKQACDKTMKALKDRRQLPNTRAPAGQVFTCNSRTGAPPVLPLSESRACVARSTHSSFSRHMEHACAFKSCL
jgi:hypothetical protein